MTAVEINCAFTAFENQLKTLCLKEFPCGLGKWREQSSSKKKQILPPKDLPQHKFSVTLTDYGPQHEKTETLEELVKSKHSVWNLDYSWSDEAKALREIAVRSPWLIDDNFVLSHFRTLRIVDKQVTEVDSNLLRFSQLEELSLSANFLKCVNSRHLPSRLRVLELCANQIRSVSELCIQPPPLIHLGLGYNAISMLDDYITGMYWPQLLSLDLSHNNLCDLMDIVKKLSTLPKLRNLLLHGNPLALVAGYRGYTIDSLKLLDILDDIHISADERHHFKGLSKRREYILDEAKMVFCVDYIRGVPMPEEIKNPEEQPEFPIVSRKYFVQFMFLEDKSTTAELFQMLHDDGLSTTTAASHTQPTELALTEGASAVDIDGVKNSVVATDNMTLEKNVNFAATLETLPSAKMPVSSVSAGGIPHDDLSVCDAEQMQKEARSVEETPIRLTAVNSIGIEWAEDIEVNWSKWVSRDDLLHLRDFLISGMDIALIEEKVESFPADEETAPSPSGGKAAKGAKADDGKKGAPAAKDAKDAKKKKKGEPDVEMTHLPAEYSTLATFHVPLEDFLDGEFEFENVFVKSSGESGSTTPASDQPIAGKKKDKKKKPESAKKKERGKSPKADKKADKGAKEKKAPDGDDDLPPPPPPLEVHVKVRLHHWKTAMDSLKEDREGTEMK